MGAQQTIESVTADQLREDDFFPNFSVGDTINVHYTIVEGDKERIQVFQGVLIGQKSRGINATITIRRIVANEGVERIFPVNMPALQRVEVNKKGKVRRSRIFYFRGLTGKKARIKEVKG